MAKAKSLVGAAGALGLALAGLGGSAFAEDRSFSYALTVGGTSDYVFRGVSQSDNDPEFQAAVDVSYGIVYAGIWGSGVDQDFVGGSPVEIDVYAGVKPVLGPLTFDFGVLYYWYPGSDDPGPEADYVELKAGVSATPIKNLSVGFNTYYSPDGTLGVDEIWAFEGNAGYTLPSLGIFTPTISGVYGYVDDEVVDANDYAYWSAGLAVAVEKFTFDFRYWDTDIDVVNGAGESLSDERFVFSAKVVLP